MNRRVLGFVCLLVGLVFVGIRPISAAGDEVIVMQVDGAVLQSMTDYIGRGIARAEDQEAAALVIELETPGGRVDEALDIVQLIRGSSVPVIMYVSPLGAEAASAGALITMAGHANAMAPDTVIGAASPVDALGEDLEETMFNKTVELLSAEMRGITQNRPKEARELAEGMIAEAQAVNAQEALDIGLIDAIAVDVPDLLKQLNGLDVVVRGETKTLETSSVVIATLEMTLLERLQQVLLNTQLVGILIAAGSVAIYAELKTPGGYVLGGIGVICLGLAFYAAGQLPINWFGAGLIVTAFVLFILETQTPTFGILTLIGSIALVFGLVVLFQTDEAPASMQIPLWSAIGIAAPTALLFFGISFAMAKTLRQQPLTGRRGMLGKKGVVRKGFKPFGTQFKGTVLTNGELWAAVADEALSAETPVTIQGFNGLTVIVKSVNS
ncbi:MAG: NfeD family protein [Candidatus Promineifilaceae bacterium]